MERKIIVLANSWRRGGRCVAGICIDGDKQWRGKWIRPIYEDPSKQNAIPKHEAKNINLLSVVSIHLKEKIPETKYQRENYFIDDSKKGENWRIIGYKKLSEVEEFCESDDPILHSNEKYTELEHMNGLPKQDWRSLILIRKNVTFRKEYDDWLGNFDDGSLKDLPVKDPIAEKILENHPDTKNGHYIMSISLAEPWEPDNNFRNIPKRCYKLIAGIIDLNV